MLNQVEQKICNRIQGLEDELIEVLSQLVSINTADPPGENYNECANFLVTYLEELSARVEIVQVAPESLPRHPSTGKPSSRPNVIAEIAGSGNGPVLHFNGHYDVVPAVGDWTFAPYKPEVKQGRLYGRGSADMKAGITAMMVAAKALKLEDINLAGTLSFSFVPQEEKDGPAGTKFLTEQKGVSADYCIVGEPSGGTDFFNGHKGCLWLEITTYGKSGHGSSPWKGINAFDKMVEVVQDINARIKPSLLHQEDIEPDTSVTSKTGTITLGGKVATGDLPNVVPPQCTLTIDRRLAPGEEVQKVLGDFSSILESLKKRDPKFSGDIKVLSRYESCVTPMESRLVDVLSESLGSVTGKTPEVSLMTAGCDMRYFHSLGIPTVIYGPGDLSMAHQTNEYVDVGRVITATQVYALTAMRLLGVPENI